MSTEHFDAVVVGSGFGGSVMACRLAEAGLRVCILERGQAYPPGSFPRTPYDVNRNFWDPSEGLFGMFNLWSFRNLGSLVSSGLGGGSLIYANVLMRMDRNWFVRDEVDGTAGGPWPVTRDELDPHYDRVERMLAPQQYPFEHAPYDATRKTAALKTAAEQLGLDFQLPLLAVTFANPGQAPVPGEPILEPHPNLHGRTRSTCRLCAECDIGCNYGSKNSLDFNYLTEARRAGADIRTLAEVEAFAPRPDGGYDITYRQHEPGSPPARGTATTAITADRLVLAAGTLGTGYLLQKNRAAFPDLSPALGTRFSGNGDLLAFALRCRRDDGDGPKPWPVDASRGPVITGAVRMPDAVDGGEGRGFYIEDAGYPAFIGWMLEASGAMGTFRRAKRVFGRRLLSALGIRKRTNYSAELSWLLGDAELSRSSIPLLGMGRDIPDGRLHLENGLLESDWAMRRSSAYFTRLRDTMRRIADVWGARFKDNVGWRLGRRVITVHPVGGCPMGRTAEEGVVNPHGEVFHYPGLHIADGSVLPGPVGANPALTIAALADRFADRIIASEAGGRSP